MQLPKSIYENLPYLYFLISGALLTLGETSHVFIFSAFIFYMAACIVLVKRSAFRRLDKQYRKQNKRWLPELIYEYLPFVYLAIGVFLLMIGTSDLLQFSAFALIVWAVRNLVCRRHNRQRKQSLF
ncbi:hypothetical protein [Thalassotalea hakodatensis]|uniref:hypothetical protein n=1 Tax=Thalassotalea hakodatensis TaxID=3030492 RepID=UPI002572A979|nr:hypothetical protein [Thalassotalea hakodatensis]